MTGLPTLRSVSSMSNNHVRRKLVGPLLFAALVVHAEPKPQEVDRKVVTGIWSLTTQEKAVTVSDVTKALHLEITQYAPTPKGGWEKVSYKQIDSADANDRNPILIFAFSEIMTYRPIPGIPGPPTKPAQTIRVIFQPGNCISAQSISAQTGASFSALFPAITSQALRAGSLINTSTLQPVQEKKLYFSRVKGNPGNSKIKAVENSLTLTGKCSRTVDIGKEFDYDYWPSRCPFHYTQQFINTIIVPALRQQYGSEYTKYAIENPQIEDYGSFMSLRFSQREALADPQTQFVMEVDRCNLKVNRTWEVPAAAIGGK